MSAEPLSRERASEAVAGVLAASAIFVSLIAFAYKPVRIAPAAFLVALLAAGMGGRHSRLAAWAVAASAVGWVVGMTIAIVTGRALY